MFRGGVVSRADGASALAVLNRVFVAIAEVAPVFRGGVVSRADGASGGRSG